MITLKQFNGSNISPRDDAVIYNTAIQDDGLFFGCAVTLLGATQLNVTDGRGILKGYSFAVEAETINAQMSSSGTVNGRLLIRIDLNNMETPIQFVTQAAASLPALEQEDLTQDGTVYEFPLATYQVSETQITGLSANPHVITPVSYPLPIALGGTQAESAAGALQNLGAAPSENLLTNWYLKGDGYTGETFPINQQGKSSYTESGMTVDRWKLTALGANATVELTNAGLEIMAAGSITFSQDILAAVPLAGQSVTISLLLSNNVLTTKSGTVPAGSGSLDSIITGNIPGVSGNITLSRNSSGIYAFEINFTAAGTITVVAAKVEIGTSQTLARMDASGVWNLTEMPDYSEEYVKCRPYDAASGYFYGLASLGMDGTVVESQIPTTLSNVTAGKANSCNGLTFAIRASSPAAAANNKIQFIY